MSAPRGRTYRLQIDVIAQEFVTFLEDGNLVLEDAGTGEYVAVELESLDQFAESNPPYTAHIVQRIRGELLDDTHDLCGWDWIRDAEANWWWREGRCPTCGAPSSAGAEPDGGFFTGSEIPRDECGLHRVAWICGARQVRLHPWLTLSWISHGNHTPHVVLHYGPAGPALHFDSVDGPTFVSPDGITHPTWNKVLGHDNEWSRVWGPVDDNQKLTPKCAAYHALATIVRFREDWRIAPALFLGKDNDPLSVSSIEDRFPSAEGAMIDYLGILEAQFNEGIATNSLEYWHEPMWVALRGDEPMALVDEAGYIHSNRQQRELPRTVEEVEILISGILTSDASPTPAASRRFRHSTGVQAAQDRLPSADLRFHERRTGVRSNERRLQRVIIPAPSIDPGEIEGGQHDWVWAVPLPYRALSSPWSGAPMPAAPAEVSDEERHFGHQIGYYASLFSFLTYSFAWTRPDKGLLWWYREGRPTEDDRLALVHDSWEADGNLLGFLAWLSSKPADLMCTFTLAPWARDRDASPLRLDAEWERRLDAARKVAPWNGGHDPFHLGTGGHIAAPSQPSSTGRGGSSTPHLLDVNTSSRTATFISETISGWYANLFSAGEDLPQLPGHRSWRVDVYAKPIGFLGTYRRSRDTGLWFAGRHRYHLAGN